MFLLEVTKKLDVPAAFFKDIQVIRVSCYKEFESKENKDTNEKKKSGKRKQSQKKKKKKEKEKRNSNDTILH